MLTSTFTQGSDQVVKLVNPLECRPDCRKSKELRNFSVDESPNYVIECYREMHLNQTLEFARKKKEEWCKFDHGEYSVMEALTLLNDMVDESDPDVDVPNIYHSFQTAEAIRAKHPDNCWLQVTGLVHDLGKIMALWGEPQWAVVGDSYPVGCTPSNDIVFGVNSFAGNPDLENPRLNTRLGIYTENCGLSNVTMVWGHDQYLYHLMRHNECYLPEEAYYIIRYHSFYPWHTEKAYDYLCDDTDRKMLDWIIYFQEFDLYTKNSELPDVDKLWPYYQSLVEKFMPGKWRF